MNYINNKKYKKDKRETKIEVKRKLIEGESVSQISSSICVSKQYIYKLIKKNNWGELNVKKSKKKEIVKMALKGFSDAEISEAINVSKSTIYRTKRKEKIKKRLTSWCKIKFPEISVLSKKYNKLFSLEGIYINESDIEAALIDLLIHTDQKDIENKDAYFRKYAKKKMNNFKTRVIKYKTKSLTNESGEEIYAGGIDPEKILLLREKLSNTGINLDDYL